MADSSLNPRDNVDLSKLEADIARVEAEFNKQLAAAREQTAAEGTKTREQITRRNRPAGGTTAASGPTEKVAIDEATASTESLVKANADALAAVRARVAVETEESRILRANAAILRNQPKLLGAASDVRGTQNQTLLAAQDAQVASARLARAQAAQAEANAARALPENAPLAAQQREYEAQAARAQALNRPLGQRLLGPGDQQRLLNAGRQPPQSLIADRPQAAGPFGAPGPRGYGAMEADAARAEQAAARAAAVQGIGAEKAAKLDSSLQYLGRSYNLSADAAAKHGLLTSETINYMLKGQVTARQFGAEITGTIAKFGGWTAAATATYGVIGALAELGKGGLQAASGVGLVSRIITTGLDTSKLQQSFRDLSKEFNLPIEDVVQAVYGSAKVFQDQAQAIDVARVALFAVKVGELSAAQATQYLTAIVYGFGLQASELPAVFDAINQAQNKFGGNVGQITAGVAKAAGVFKLAGGNYSELIALIETGTKVTGASGENVGTAIARSASRVLTPQGGAALAAVGITPGGTYSDILKQAFTLAQKGTPEEVNAIARALVPQGGQFARIFTPILQNQGLYNKVQAQIAPDKSQGSAARELAKALSQPDELLKSLVYGAQRLGSALASAGGLNGLGVLIKALSGVLSLTTNLVEEVGKIPGIQVAAPFLELYGVIKALKYFNLGGSLGPAGGGIGGFAKGLVTQSPDKQLDVQVRKDQGAVGQLAAQESQAAQLQARRAANNAKHLNQLAQEANLSTEEQAAANTRANLAYKASEEASAKAALAVAETTEIARQTNVYLAARKAGMTAELATIKAGIAFTSGTLEYGAGGKPLTLGQAGPAASAGAVALAARAASGAQGGAAVAAGAADAAVVEGAVAARAAAAAAAGQLSLLPVEVKSATAKMAETTSAGYEQMVLFETEGWARILEVWAAGNARLVLLAREGIAAAGGAVAAGAAVAGRAGAGIAGTLGKSVSPLVATAAIAFTAKDIYDYYDSYSKQIDSFNKLANAGAVNLQKVVAQGTADAEKDKTTLSKLAADLFQFKIGDIYNRVVSGIGTGIIHAYGGTTPKDQEAETTRRAAAEQAHLALAQGQTLSPAELKTLAFERDKSKLLYASGHPTIDPDQAATERAIQNEATKTARSGKGTLLTQAQIEQQVKQRLGGAFSPQAQIAVYEKALAQETRSLATTTPGDKGSQVAMAGETDKLHAAIALVQAGMGNLDALAKALDDGSLKIDVALGALEADIALNGLTKKNVRTGHAIAAGAIRQIGVATATGASPAAALKQYHDAIQAILDPAQTDYTNALAVAKTPAQTRAAQSTFLAANREAYTGVARSAIKAGQIKVSEERGVLAGPELTASARTEALAALKVYDKQVDAARALLKQGKATYDTIAAGMKTNHLSDALALIDANAGLAAASTSDPVAQARDALDGTNKKIALLAAAGKTQSADYINLLTTKRQQQQAIVTAQESLIDANAGLAAASTSDPIAAATDLLDATNEKIALLAKSGQTQSAEYINLLTTKQQQQQAIVADQIAAFQSNQGVATAQASIGATQGQTLARSLSDAQASRREILSLPGVTPTQANDALKAVYDAQAALAAYVREQAQALIQAQGAYKQSGTLDPVKIARDQLHTDRQLVSFAQTPADKIKAEATVRTDRTGLRTAKYGASYDTIQFNLSMERIDNATAAAEILALARRVKNNKALKRQYEVEAHNLQKEADSGGYELNVGSIKLPSPYEVFRAIKEAGRASSGSTSVGAVHATTHATVNVYVGSKGDAPAVYDALDSILTTHVRSTLRAKGAL